MIYGDEGGRVSPHRAPIQGQLRLNVVLTTVPLRRGIAARGSRLGGYPEDDNGHYTKPGQARYFEAFGHRGLETEGKCDLL